MTVQSVVSMVSEKLQEHDSGELEFIFKDGGDGSGQQVVWNSTSMLNTKKKTCSSMGSHL